MIRHFCTRLRTRCDKCAPISTLLPPAPCNRQCLRSSSESVSSFVSLSLSLVSFARLKRSVIPHHRTVISHQVGWSSPLSNLLLHSNTRARVPDCADTNTSRGPATCRRCVGGLRTCSGVRTEIRSKPEETLSLARSLVRSLEITQEPYLTRSKATSTVFPGRLVKLPEELAGPASVGLVRAWPRCTMAIWTLDGFVST